MPPRFVEVVDVQAEASQSLAVLLARGVDLATALSYNVTDYLNSTNTTWLWERIAQYNNLTIDAVPAEWLTTLERLGVNTSAPEQYVPEGHARGYMLAALLLVVSREVYVHWRVKRLLRVHGIHAH